MPYALRGLSYDYMNGNATANIQSNDGGKFHVITIIFPVRLPEGLSSKESEDFIKNMIRNELAEAARFEAEVK